MSPGSHQCVFISGTNEVDADVLKELLDLANCETSMRTGGEEEVKISNALEFHYGGRVRELQRKLRRDKSNSAIFVSCSK